MVMALNYMKNLKISTAVCAHAFRNMIIVVHCRWAGYIGCETQHKFSIKEK